MSSNPSVDAFAQALEQFIAGPLGGPALQRACEAVAAPMLAEAQRRAPVGSGDLRLHVELVASHGNHSAHAVVQVADSATGGAEHHKAMAAEYGTSREAARPFMRPAWQAHQARAPEEFQAALAAQFPAT